MPASATKLDCPLIGDRQSQGQLASNTHHHHHRFFDDSELSNTANQLLARKRKDARRGSFPLHPDALIVEAANNNTLSHTQTLPGQGIQRTRSTAMVAYNGIDSITIVAFHRTSVATMSLRIRCIMTLYGTDFLSDIRSANSCRVRLNCGPMAPGVSAANGIIFGAFLYFLCLSFSFFFANHTRSLNV